MTVLPEVEKHYGKLKFFINGSWMDSTSEQIYEDVNPATGEVIAEFPSATDSEIEQAIQTAQTALEKWREVPLRDKARYLFDLRGKFEEHFDRLCRVLVQDHGRTIGVHRKHRICLLGPTVAHQGRICNRIGQRAGSGSVLGTPGCIFNYYAQQYSDARLVVICPLCDCQRLPGDRQPQ
jgi:hypothetical protein